MIFNEIYGCYYNAVAKMLSLAIDGALSEKEMYRIAAENAYDESVLSIIPAIKQQAWQVIDSEQNTPLIHKPTMPLTELEKRWLKTILLDPRIALFSVPTNGLQDVEPLFNSETVVYFDRYLDGDNYTDPNYIVSFHTVMRAIRERRKVRIDYWNNRNRKRADIFAPVKMEYSDKEDKFRILASGKRNLCTINMGRIIECELLDEYFDADLKLPERVKSVLVFELTDTRNALERAMMKFAHYKKQAEKTGDHTYRVEMEYDTEDETDVLIQLLSFGSAVHVLSPETIREELALRLQKQLLMMDW